MQGTEFTKLQAEVEALAKRWKKRGGMSKNDLLREVDKLLLKVKDKPKLREQLKEWVDLTIMLDANVENSHSVLIGTCVSMVLSIISILISILTSVEIIQGMMVGAIMILVIFIVMIALIVLFPLVKKHGGGYAREKAFYELLLEQLEK